MYPAVSFWELLQLYIPTGNYRNIVAYCPELVKLEASFGCALLVYMGNEPDCRGSIHHVRVQERATLGDPQTDVMNAAPTVGFMIRANKGKCRLPISLRSWSVA